ncbi:ion channel [Solitalea koreensis]|uniref:Inward rectifier potassium channel n=1 Tax=Solitalea koreensis TaxID=543615 RepID=A0A521BQC3_9SPHI|nr:ion channel [Solitalea koreensis]SMO49362.1 inward rectifier potassium channel [Solitalea koreensis]
MKYLKIGKKFWKYELHDLGFSERLTGSNHSINKNGSFNVQRVGHSSTTIDDIYNNLINMKWSKFCLVILTWFIVINALFAFIYMAVGTEYLAGAHGRDKIAKFLDCFFFSAQTLSTVGYGHLSPSNYWMSGVAALECLLGLLGFALATGLLYGRFSRPAAKILYSENMLVSPYQDKQAIMFRIVNGRKTQLIETEIKLILALNVDEDSKKVRRFFDLALERSKVSFFPMSWTVVHPLDENSVLFGYTPQMLEEAGLEILISIKAFDEVYSQTVYSRYSYLSSDIVWNARFTPMIGARNGINILALDSLNEFEILETETINQ